MLGKLTKGPNGIRDNKKKDAFWNFGTLELPVNGLKFCDLCDDSKVPEFHLP